ncbi:MAG: site-specific DNA-methyltransferase [Lacrimispora sp.]|uniref:site-specific DNA-methyltransferase n=1 Tax=Lacrimispora sp. TaxID=2719234 RepID=UPI0039E511B5
MKKLKINDNYNKNYNKLKAILPHAFTEKITGYDENGTPIIERAIDIDILKAEIGCVPVEGKEERYRFTWPDKQRGILLSNEPTTSTLRPCKSKSINFNSTKNVYIEGDNIEVLKILQETYLDKIKLIYIDPPYNTGKDSFVYDDNFILSNEEFNRISGKYDDDGNILFNFRLNNETNGRFHTDWLNMMYPRLRLARNLMSDEGIILINMDENEIVNLQKICAEIFGEQNDLGTIIWDKRNPKGDARGISYQHEYILAYAKNKNTFLDSCKMQRLKKNADMILAKAKALFSKMEAGHTLEEINTEFSQWISKQAELSGGEKAYNKIDEHGEVYRGVSMAWPNKKKAPDDYFIPLIHPVTQKPCPIPERGWRNPSATMKDLQNKGLILFGKDETTQPTRKYLLSENMYENIPSLIYYGGSDTALLEGLGVPFDTPKVVEICKEHIMSFTGKDDIILDFFSGSGTVAHAVMAANAEDNLNRTFIMVQIPEECGEETPLGQAGFKNICDAGEMRIAKAGEMLKNINPSLDCGFRVFSCASSNMEDVYYSPAEYSQTALFNMADNIKADRTAEDLLYQVMLELGILLSSDIAETGIDGKRVFSVENGFLMACFDSAITDEVVTEIAKKKPHYAVFRDGGMTNDSVMANFEQIFAAYSPGTVRRIL